MTIQKKCFRLVRISLILCVGDVIPIPLDFAMSGITIDVGGAVDMPTLGGTAAIGIN